MHYVYYQWENISSLLKKTSWWCMWFLFVCSIQLLVVSMVIFSVCGYIEYHTNYWRGFRDTKSLTFPKITETVLRALMVVQSEQLQFSIYKMRRQITSTKFQVIWALISSVLCENNNWGKSKISYWWFQKQQGRKKGKEPKEANVLSA